MANTKFKTDLLFERLGRALLKHGIICNNAQCFCFADDNITDMIDKLAKVNPHFMTHASKYFYRDGNKI